MERHAEAPQKLGGTSVLLRAAAVGQVAAGDDQLGREPLDQLAEARLDPELLSAAHVQIRDVEEAPWHPPVQAIH